MKTKSNKTSNSKHDTIQSNFFIGLIIITLITLILGFSYYSNVRRIDKQVTAILVQTGEINDSISNTESEINAHKSVQQILEITKSENRKATVFVLLSILLSTFIFIWVANSFRNNLSKIILKINNLSDEDLSEYLPVKTKSKFAILNFFIAELEDRKRKLQLTNRAREIELKEANNLLENAIENASIGMVMVSLDNKFKRVNKAFTQLIGYNKEELKSLTFNEITHKDDLEIGPDFIKKVMNGDNTIISFEKRYMHKNGSIIYAAITSALIRDEKNNPLYFFTQVSDISQQKYNEKELEKNKLELENEAVLRASLIEEKTGKLEKSQVALSYLLEDVNDIREQLEISNIKLTSAYKELEAFSYSVSHDLKAPLRAIDGFSKILIEDHYQSLDAEGRRVLQVIIDNAIKMRLLIEDILEISRLGRKQLVFSYINLNLMLKDIILEFESATKNRSVIWKISAVPDVKGDRVLIKQLLINLISNAVKFTSKKDETIIEIGHFEEEGKTVFFVKDNGVGFEMKYVEKVFEVFQRLHLAEEFEGTGIGLAIVKRIIEKHNGKIWIESKLDVGTQIYFTI